MPRTASGSVLFAGFGVRSAVLKAYRLRATATESVRGLSRDLVPRPAEIGGEGLVTVAVFTP